MNARALKGGLDAWTAHGYAVEPVPLHADTLTPVFARS